MASKLKIYACSGIGAVKSETYNYWTDNTNTLSNTQAVNTLLANINLNLSELENLELGREDVIRKLNEIDFYVVCLHAAQSYSDDLEHAKDVIGHMIKLGLFNCQETENTERDEHLDYTLNTFEEWMGIEISSRYSVDGFREWFDENVISRNVVGLTKQQQAKVESALSQASVSGIGDTELNWQDNKELAEYLTKGSTYFLYTYFTNAQLNSLPDYNRRRFTLKKKQQLATYNYCKSLFVGIYGSEKEMQKIIRAGIIGRFKVSPEEVCIDIAEGRRTVEGVGQLASSVIAAIISAAVTITIAIINLICKAVADSKASQYAAIDEKAIESSCPDEGDYDGLLDESASANSKNGSILPIILAAGAGLYFLTK